MSVPPDGLIDLDRALNKVGGLHFPEPSEEAKAQMEEDFQIYVERNEGKSEA